MIHDEQTGQEADQAAGRRPLMATSSTASTGAVLYGALESRYVRRRDEAALVGGLVIQARDTCFDEVITLASRAARVRFLVRERATAA